jgi:hypothetical protein
MQEKIFCSRPGATVWQAVLDLAPLFPKPTCFATSVGFNLRKQRLGRELAEFDLQHRLQRGSAASPGQMRAVGRHMIAACGDRFPSATPAYQPLLVDIIGFEKLIEISATGDDQADSLSG